MITWESLLSAVGINSATGFTVKDIGGILAFIAALILALILFAAAQSIVGHILKGRVAEQTAMLIRKAIRYTGFVLVALAVFNRLGLDLNALLGAAGIAGIAVGFAAQTSVSNIISGLFLVSEKAFAIGDVITVGEVTGIVQSVDLLSIKIQTFDNKFIRIPNETLIKSNVVNITRYPIRRLDIWVSVSYTDDLARVKTLLEDIARDNVYVLDNPEPLILIEKFDASGINILFGLWFEQSVLLDLKNSVMMDIRRRFAAEGVSLPIPQLRVHSGDGFGTGFGGGA